MLQLAERLGLDLLDALAGDAELLAEPWNRSSNKTCEVTLLDLMIGLEEGGPMRMWQIAILAVLASCGTVQATSPDGRNLVVSERSPELTLEIDPTFVALPPLRFPIENLTIAERRIFVAAAPDRTVDRMVIVQFEKVQPGSDFRFVFPSTPPRRFGSETYRFGTFGYDDEAAAERAPLKEPGKTREFLRSHGYAPPKLYRVARLARVSDPQGLSEVIIFYQENADKGLPPTLRNEDGDWELSPAEARELTQRLEATVRALKG